MQQSFILAKVDFNFSKPSPWNRVEFDEIKIGFAIIE